MMQETLEARQLAHLVVEHLGGGDWCVDESDELTCGVMTGPNGERVYLRIPTYGQHTDKVEVSGSYPGTYDQRYGIEHHEIRVTRSRGAQVIAREINRRFLPQYQQNLIDVRTRILRDDNNAQKRQRVGGELAGALGATYNAEHESIWYSPQHAGYGDIKISHDATTGSVEVRGIPIELVRQLVDVLARYTEERCPVCGQPDNCGDCTHERTS